MSSSSLLGLTAHQLQGLLEKKETSSEELVREYLARIEQNEEQLQAFVTVTSQEALQKAKKIDEKRSRGEQLQPLAGIPLALSDNLCTEGIETTCSSRMLKGYRPPYSATIVEKMQQAEAVLLGKCNLDEFGLGCSTENSAFFPTRNPYDQEAVPGGACGGAAAAVAAQETVFALGSDTGGSLRQPASFCGVIGLKPTYGLVSRYGLIATASSLDQAGCFTRDLTDCALVMETIYGRDSKDSTSVNLKNSSDNKADFTGYLVNDVKGLKIGLPKEYLQEGIDPQITAYLRQAAAKLEELGAVCEEVSLPHTEYAYSCYKIILAAEVSSNLGRYDGVRYGLRVEGEDLLSMYKRSRSEGFGEEAKKQIIFGTYVLSSGQYEAYYLQAMKVRTLIKEEFEQIFQKYDCLLTPTTPTVAFNLGDKGKEASATGYRAADALTCPANLAGIPALSLPFGMVHGRPVGLQLLGRAFGEGTILRVAYTLEQNTNLTQPSPVVKGGK